MNNKPDKNANLTVGVCDLNGVLRGKRITPAQRQKALSGGIRMPLSTCSADIWGNDLIGNKMVMETGDQDGICLPTGRGFMEQPWLGEGAEFLPITMNWEDGRAYESDPRRALESVVARFKERGWTPIVASELEFYLVDPQYNTPHPPSAPLSGKRLSANNVLAIDDLDLTSAFFNEVYATCKKLDIPADAAISEGGAGQFEINLLHGNDPMKAADDALYFKRLVKGIARKHGMAASFMAKPYLDKSGNGFHIHFSVLDENSKNIFDNGTAEGSPLMQFAVGGLLQAMSESALIFAPHFNSYRRFAHESHAPTAICWGYENRTAAIRIPGGPPVAKRIEHRVSGADINPYLVIAAILGSALYGIENQIKPAEPESGNAYLGDHPRIPNSWLKAISTFENAKILPDIFSPLLMENFRACKQQELDKFFEEITEREIETYLDVV